MATMNARTLRRTAQVLEEDVVAIRQLAMKDDRWPPGTRDIRNRCYEKIKLARELRELAKTIPA